MIRFEHEPRSSFQIKRKLPGAISAQWVWPARHEVNDARGGLKIGESGAQLAGAGGAEFSVCCVLPLT